MPAMKPELHYATDRRCYNGAYCSDLQKEIDSKVKFRETIKKEFPSYTCTYFPAEEKWMAFLNHHILTGNMFFDEGECLEESWRILFTKAQEEANDSQ